MRRHSLQSDWLRCPESRGPQSCLGRSGTEETQGHTTGLQPESCLTDSPGPHHVSTPLSTGCLPASWSVVGDFLSRGRLRVFSVCLCPLRSLHLPQTSLQTPTSNLPCRSGRPVRLLVGPTPTPVDLSAPSPPRSRHLSPTTTRGKIPTLSTPNRSDSSRKLPSPSRNSALLSRPE